MVADCSAVREVGCWPFVVHGNPMACLGSQPAQVAGFLPSLTNAPATFQRLMDFLFNDLRFSGTLCYLDDILVHAPTFDEALQRLRTVFTRLRAAGLTLNLAKSVFFPRVLKYLGQIVRDGKLIPDQKKIEALHRIQPPMNITEVRSLLGLIGCYQSYIKGYAEVQPIFNLLRAQKNSKRVNQATPVQWLPIHQTALENAVALLEPAVLLIPLDSDCFLVETDASGSTVAAILSVRRDQTWHPVEYYSKTLSQTQRNWPAREREAFAIIAALQKFDYYLRGRAFEVHTDHESLKWMLDCPKGKIARWASLMAEYEMKIVHKRGEELSHVDFLTRHLDAEPDPALADRMCYFTSTSSIPTLQQVLDAQAKHPPLMTTGYTLNDNVIHYHGHIWVPPPLRMQVIAACHSVAPFHHPGIKKTKSTILRVFNWPNLHQDVTNYLQSCLFCKRSRSNKERLQGLFRSHPLPGAFATVYMDFWQCHYNGKDFIVLTLIDQLTKWVECVPLASKTAIQVATALLTSWVYRFGMPQTLISDNDPSFCNAVLDRLTAKLGINRLQSTVYHPEGNAVIESFHRTLNRGLRHVSQAAMPFEEALAMVVFGYRSTIHGTTGHSPAYLAYGVDPRLAPDNDWRMERQIADQERLKFLSLLRLRRPTSSTMCPEPFQRCEK